MKSMNSTLMKTLQCIVYIHQQVFDEILFTWWTRHTRYDLFLGDYTSWICSTMLLLIFHEFYHKKRFENMMKRKNFQSLCGFYVWHDNNKGHINDGKKALFMMPHLWNFKKGLHVINYPPFKLYKFQVMHVITLWEKFVYNFERTLNFGILNVVENLDVLWTVY